MELQNLKFLIVGTGFFGSVVAERIANELGEKVLVIDKRDHIGGNCFSETHSHTGIEYHKYGTHIFHTSDEKVWNYINRFTNFNAYRHQVLTTYKNKVYQMPINLETINSFYNLNLKPFEVRPFLEKEIRKENITAPENFEEKAISLVGRPLYEAFLKGYTLKQWQRHPRELPAELLNRLPFRTSYDENYFHSRWQGIPLHGYTPIFEKMLNSPKISVKLNTDFFDIRDQISPSTQIIYSGSIDRYFNFKFGNLDWRSLRFEKEIIPVVDYQGTSVMNYAEARIPYTRIHEPKHLHPERENPFSCHKTLTIREFSIPDNGNDPFYPVKDQKNQELVLKYRREANKLENVFISGRLGDYKYYDMDQTIAMALETFQTIKKKLEHK